MINSREKEKFDFLFIIPLPKEFDTFKEKIEIKKSKVYNSETFFLLNIPNSDYTGIAIICHTPGIKRATNVTKTALNFFDVKMVINMGYAGGVDDDLKLEDVVIARSVIDYQTNSKATRREGEEESYQIIRSTDSVKTNHSLVACIDNFKYNEEKLYEEFQNNSNTLFNKLGLDDSVKKLVNEKPKYYVGKIASGNIVSASRVFINEIREKIDRKIIAIEMEAAGIVSVTWELPNSISTLIIRGITDLADEKKKEFDNTKDGVFRKYAMCNAVEFFLVLIHSNSFQKMLEQISSFKDESSKVEVQTKEEEILEKAEKKAKKIAPQLKRLILRASIWKAYNKKCLYCGDLISRLENLEVDHIIPKKYKNRPEEFEKIKKDYGLQWDFDIDAYYNRAPSHKGCNVKKLDHLYLKTATLFYIEEATIKIPKIEEYEKKLGENVSISEEMLEGEINNEKLRKFFEMMGVSYEEEPIIIEVINERALLDHINSFKNSLEIIREKGPEAFEWRYYKIRAEARKVFNYWDKMNVYFLVIDKLIKLMDVFINEDNKILQNWGIDILNLLTSAPNLLQIIIEKCYDQLISHYEPSILNQQLVDLLDKCEYFPDDTIPEIIDLINNQYVKPLSCFKDRLYNKKFTISREKSQSYIDNITYATMDLEPRTNQSHNTIIRYANEVKELLNKID